jgi:hypothetical protein
VRLAGGRKINNWGYRKDNERLSDGEMHIR